MLENILSLKCVHLLSKDSCFHPYIIKPAKYYFLRSPLWIIRLLFYFFQLAQIITLALFHKKFFPENIFVKDCIFLPYIKFTVRIIAFNLGITRITKKTVFSKSIPKEKEETYSKSVDLSLSTHPSSWDGMVTFLCGNYSFIAKKELAESFIIGNVVYFWNCYFVDRKDEYSKEKIKEKLKRSSRNDNRITHISPEGTINSGNGIISYGNDFLKTKKVVEFNVIEYLDKNSLLVPYASSNIFAYLEIFGGFNHTGVTVNSLIMNEEDDKIKLIDDFLKVNGKKKTKWTRFDSIINQKSSDSMETSSLFYDYKYVLFEDLKKITGKNDMRVREVVESVELFKSILHKEKNNYLIGVESLKKILEYSPNEKLVEIDEKLIELHKGEAGIKLLDFLLIYLKSK